MTERKPALRNLTVDELQSALDDALHESVTFRNIRAGSVDTEDVDCRGLALQLAHIVYRNLSHYVGDDCTEEDGAHFDALEPEFDWAEMRRLGQ
jgi:hypothetical protein